ncbi:MvaI/BcnI restriction endonuclease family protein [Thalassospiraceae bacterium SW-3-3]|nr:MvaI/BcnI restriction endonuclease family protein [Thalassospiraceae bacterium SW-3-3]
MNDNLGTYDTDLSHKASLDKVVKIMADKGVREIYVKELAPNDNSKNQPYLGYHLTDLPFIPTGNIEASESTSKKKKPEKSGREIKYQAAVNFHWIDAHGDTYPAPHAKLIYYPQYPEVRLSGFLLGSKVRLSRWMAPEKEGRALGRWLLLGISRDETVYAYLATPGSSLSNELQKTELTRATNIFGLIDVQSRSKVKDTRAALLQKLLEIHNMGWVKGQKLRKDLSVEEYKAANGGGYTLEALLGISPNGRAEPDYLGWEIKQFGVKDFPAKSAKPTTLMTPEPNGGVYGIEGAAKFVRCFGYPDKSGKPDRLNFGGKHVFGKECAATKLTLSMDGFDFDTHKISRANGSVTLIDRASCIAASWSFEKLMNHWKRKHSHAAYIPCRMRSTPTGQREYYYGRNIELGIGTTFEMFLSAMLGGDIYYDPGIKLENASTAKAKTKRRSQFRINHKHLDALYKDLENIDIGT